MIRLLLIFSFLSLSMTSSCSYDEDNSSGGNCCRQCSSNSKPCGDACISLQKTCNKGPGCACYRQLEFEEETETE